MKTDVLRKVKSDASLEKLRMGASVNWANSKLINTLFFRIVNTQDAPGRASFPASDKSASCACQAAITPITGPSTPHSDNLPFAERQLQARYTDNTPLF